jgi:hypothetical protein
LPRKILEVWCDYSLVNSATPARQLHGAAAK